MVATAMTSVYVRPSDYKLAFLKKMYLFFQHGDQEAAEHNPCKGAGPWGESGGTRERLRGQWLCF